MSEHKFKIGQIVEFTLEQQKLRNYHGKGIIAKLLEYSGYSITWLDDGETYNYYTEQELQLAVPEINEQKLKKALGLE